MSANPRSDQRRHPSPSILSVLHLGFVLLFFSIPLRAEPETSPAALQALAQTYYSWRNENYPVSSSDEGLHTWDDRLTDYSLSAIRRRQEHVVNLLKVVQTMPGLTWAKEDEIDWLLFRAQLEAVVFGDRVLKFYETNPQIYTDECSYGIFTLLKRDDDTPQHRAMAALARLQNIPALLQEARKNLQHPSRLYAQLAIGSARAIDPLFNQSLKTLTDSLEPRERQRADQTKQSALSAIHAFADDLEKQLPRMPFFNPMGEGQYDYLLRHVYLLPLTAKQIRMLGESELVRYRGLEALLSDPHLAEPDLARVKTIPKDEGQFLQSYESRQKEIIEFIQSKNLFTLPPYLGIFHIRPLPAAFRPTAPGGFMYPPGLYDKDSSGTYYIPAYTPGSTSFYIRAAIEDPRPIMGHEGIPGHFLQLSVAHQLRNPIRRQHADVFFSEGWALYTEEMLMRTGLYPDNSPAQGQVLRLSRMRAARVGMDVSLHSGTMTYDQAIDYMMKAGGLDRDSATGEVSDAASEPGQKISYIVGKWQMMRLLGRYRDAQGERFRLRQFHDAVLQLGTLPLSIIDWLMLDDRSSLSTNENL